MLLASLTYYPLYTALGRYARPGDVDYSMSMPIAAFPAELFPARIRYTSVSVPYHIGNGWGGGLVPIVTTSAYVSTGRALAYPIALPLLMFFIALFVMPETRKMKIWNEPIAPEADTPSPPPALS